MRGLTVVAVLVVIAILASGHRDRVSTPVAVAAAGLAILYFRKKLRNHDERHQQFLSALDAHVGSKRDHDWVTLDRGRRTVLATWVAQKRFYFAPEGAALNPRNFYGSDDVRGWEIERTVRDSGSRWRYVYDVNIAVKSAERPLLKFHCGRDEAVAYLVAEMLTQMFGDKTAEQSLTTYKTSERITS